MAQFDRDWLKEQLAAALGWDPAVAEGIVEAIATAESQEEVEQLIQVTVHALAAFSPFWATLKIVHGMDKLVMS